MGFCKASPRIRTEVKYCQLTLAYDSDKSTKKREKYCVNP